MITAITVILVLMSMYMVVKRTGFQLAEVIGPLIVGLAAVIWAGILDTLIANPNLVVHDTTFYGRILLWSLSGIGLCLVGFVSVLILSRDRTVRRFTGIMGVVIGSLLALYVIIPR